ncbi:hypothetical protein MAR_022416 [Mya arenaria]|uniref:Uncharacterized protein n=1 Tax=Mya arenaria TaxID=6604 RepID=A0ABY7DLI0_MYAAR|nr:hypothetical protein MAR_022416 [Mya arenaria]
MGTVAGTRQIQARLYLASVQRTLRAI